MRIIGIDPGLDGGIAILTEHGVEAHPMPTSVMNSSRREIDVCRLDALFDLYPSYDLVVIENVQSDPKFGSASSFTFGKGFGAALAVIQLRGLPHLRVRPQEWKATVLAGTDKSKEAAIAHVQRLYPTLNLILPGKRKPSHDLAEAVCLARYGKEQL